MLGADEHGQTDQGQSLGVVRLKAGFFQGPGNDAASALVDPALDLTSRRVSGAEHADGALGVVVEGESQLLETTDAQDRVGHLQSLLGQATAVGLLPVQEHLADEDRTGS
ncbi:MAG: hypothetical protein M3137_17395 [Actinomycetota bacterium]|nr:hypothetical protein [Actinomycetota bacterium]